MTKTEIIALVRKLINDEQATGYTDNANLEQPDGTAELINYLDRAVAAYSARQAEAGDLRLIKTLKVTSGMSIPDEFLKFAGHVPVSVTGKTFSFYGRTSTLPVRYFARLPYVSAYGDKDTLPYEHDQEMSIAALAAIYALNKHEFNVSQDLALLGMGGAVTNAAVNEQAQ